ncbi:MAG: phosphatidylserine/phosphatidylglycerophosphate/c ardiolipin synthase family protein [Simkaniaceae bacterium]
MLYLSKFLQGMQNVAFWESSLEKMHRQMQANIRDIDSSDKMQPLIKAYNSFYQKFSQNASFLFNFPMTLKQRDIIFSRLQKFLVEASFPNDLRQKNSTTTPLTVHVCQDSTEGTKQKLALMEKARHSIALSGCYLGNQVFSKALKILEKKFIEIPGFKAYILGSDYMLSSENKQLLKELQNRFPQNFTAVITPEVYPFKNPKTGTFSLTSNHVKLLVIDEGTDFLLGGSGIEDRWADLDGTEQISPPPSQILPNFEPLAFRDTDFVFHSPTSDGIGKVMHFELLKLFSHCCHHKEEDFAKRYLDPRFYPLAISKKESGSKEERTSHPEIKIEFYASGPEETSNKFHERLVQLAEQAKERIIIDHMYFHPSDKLLKALIDASHRGVVIQIITNQAENNAPGTHQLFVPASRNQWKRLFENQPKPNISIYEYNVPYTTLHKKIFIADDILATGSSNCGFKSLESRDYEFNVVLQDKNTVEQTIKTIEKDIEHSRRIPSDSYVISLQDSLVEMVTKPLGQIL